MGGAIHRPCCRAGVNAKHEDEWWLNERKRDDRATAAGRLLSMPVFAEVNCAMLDIIGVSYSTREQNKDISESNAEARQRNFNKGVDVDGDEDV